MGKLSPLAIIIIIAAVFLAIGGAFVYCNNCGSYSANAHINSEGTIDYTISGPSTNFGYSVFSETKKYDTIYLYYDESYAEFYNSKYVQKEYFNVLKFMLERRNATVSYVDSNGLVGVMDNGNNAVVFVTGALPDTIYDGKGTCKFVSWMKSGGTVYWTGPEIGRYILSTTGTTDLGTGFFGGNVNSGDSSKMAYNTSSMFEYTQTCYDDCAYGLKADLKDSKPLAFVSDDGYSSVSVAKMYNGNVTVVGGNMTRTYNTSQAMTDRTCIADLMICGLTHLSTGIEHHTGDMTGKIVSSTSVKVSSYHNVNIWFFVGEQATHWGKCIKIS